MNGEEGIQRLEEIEMLEWICGLRPACAHWKGPGDTLFTKTVRNKFVKGVPESLKMSVITLLCRPDLTGELQSLNWET